MENQNIEAGTWYLTEWLLWHHVVTLTIQTISSQAHYCEVLNTFHNCDQFIISFSGFNIDLVQLTIQVYYYIWINMASFVLAIEITSIYLIYLLYKITITNVPFQMFSGFFSNISRNFSFGVNLAIVEKWPAFLSSCIYRRGSFS